MRAYHSTLVGGLLASALNVCEAQELWSIDCELSSRHLLLIAQGSVKSERDTSKPFLLTFTNFDARNGTATLVGNAGAVPISYSLDDRKLVLLQVTDTGNMTLTTMNRPERGKPIAAVHSRHIWIFGEGVISQWAGDCRLR